jgi:uncharacterized protein YvpB
MSVRAAALACLLLVAACGPGSPRADAIAAPPAASASPSPAMPLPAPSPATPPRPAQRVLSLRIHYQQHNLTCEAAALEMALSYAGITAGELKLLAYMTRDPRPARFDSAGRLVSWGDPQKGFVGDPDGHIQTYGGYGVYFGPVAIAAVLAGAHVVDAGGGLYGSGISPTRVYDAVLDGHPVVAWISNTYRTASLSRYTAYDGATVWYTLTEHAVTVIGVRPGAVLIDDPWFGQAWHPKAQFEAAYATFKQMAVIVAR